MSSGGDSAPRPVPRRLAPAIVCGVVLLDQLTKSWVVAALGDGPLAIIGSDVELRLTRNSGGAFSLFTDATVVLAIVACILSVFLVRAVHRARDRMTVVALSLVLGGALGNLSDRLLRTPGFPRGKVVDFVHVGPWPSFNVADSAITIGAILLVIATFRQGAVSPSTGARQ